MLPDGREMKTEIFAEALPRNESAKPFVAVVLPRTGLNRIAVALGCGVLVLILMPTALYAKKSDAEVCADAWTARNTDMNLAIAKITTVIDANTRDWSCFEFRGLIYWDKGLQGDQGAFDKAIADASRAIELSHGKETAPYKIRAVAYLRLRRWDLALADDDLLVARE